jgi:hypothetical protein
MKRALAVLVLALLASTLAGTLFINLAFASLVNVSSIELRSPEDNKAYSANSVKLVFTYTVTDNDYDRIGDEPPPTYTCYLDGYEVDFGADFDGSSYVGSIWLSDGYHDLSIGVRVYYYAFTSWTGTISTIYATGYSEVVHIVVATSWPRFLFLSMEEMKTYNTTAVPFDFTVSQPVAWAGYSLDKGANVTVDAYRLSDFTSKGHAMLTGLSEGWHTMVVYARNLVGRETSKLVNFKIETQEKPVDPESPSTNPEPSFTTTQITVAIIASAAAVSFGLVAYFLRQKRRRAA